MVTPAVREQALADLVGAMSYALLRVFQRAAQGIGSAPTVDLAERQAAFAADEFERYRILRERLRSLTADPDAAMAAFRSTIDTYYDSADAAGWLETQVFHYVGNMLTTDFAEILSVHLDERTAADVRRALTGRTEQEAFALQQITEALQAEGVEAKERIRAFTSAMVGSAMNRMRDALLASDALEVVLGGPAAVKDVVLELLGRHRERLERLGVDTVE